MPPRVISVCLDLSPSHGGMYRAVTDLARMLGSPIVTFRDGSGREPPDVGNLSVTTIDWSNRSLVQQAGFPPRDVRHAFEATLADAECVVVHSLFRSHCQMVHRVAMRRRIPYLIVPHGALEPALWRTKRFLRNAWMLAGGRAFLRDAFKLVFATRAERANAEQTLRRPLNAEVIPFAVTARRSAVTGIERAAARSQLGLPSDRLLLLVLGRLDPVKRPAEIVKWFCDAEPEGCDLVIAGMDGRITADELRADINPGCRSRVWFLGALDAPRRDAAIAACDGYLSWSKHESFGYAAAESMAAGLPVIMPPGHGLWPDIRTSGCGIFSVRDDAVAYAQSLREFAGWTVDERRSRGQLARSLVGNLLDPGTIRTRWEQLIAAAIG